MDDYSKSEIKIEDPSDEFDEPSSYRQQSFNQKKNGTNSLKKSITPKEIDHGNSALTTIHKVESARQRAATMEKGRSPGKVDHNDIMLSQHSNTQRSHKSKHD